MTIYQNLNKYAGIAALGVVLAYIGGSMIYSYKSTNPANESRQVFRESEKEELKRKKLENELLEQKVAERLSLEKQDLERKVQELQNRVSSNTNNSSNNSDSTSGLSSIPGSQSANQPSYQLPTTNNNSNSNNSSNNQANNQQNNVPAPGETLGTGPDLSNPPNGMTQIEYFNYLNSPENKKYRESLNQNTAPGTQVNPDAPTHDDTPRFEGNRAFHRGKWFYKQSGGLYISNDGDKFIADR